MDVCFLVDDASVTELATTLHGCHCLPEWGLDGVLYHGCSTPVGHGVQVDEEQESWCRVAEDETHCTTSLGPEHVTANGGGRGVGRWDWCRPNPTPSAAQQDWRASDERFTPMEPDPPQWFYDYQREMNAGISDLDQ